MARNPLILDWVLRVRESKLDGDDNNKRRGRMNLNSGGILTKLTETASSKGEECRCRAGCGTVCAVVFRSRLKRKNPDDEKPSNRVTRLMVETSATDVFRRDACIKRRVVYRADRDLFGKRITKIVRMDITRFTMVRVIFAFNYLVSKPVIA